MRYVLSLALVLAAACGDNKPGVQQDAGTQALAPCLDEPEGLLRPPTDQLPCELLPPGFQAP